MGETASEAGSRGPEESPAQPPVIGLIAGNGAFPILFAQAARRQGVRVVAVAHRGETDPRLAEHVDALSWVRVGQVGHVIEALRRAGVTRAAMAGGVQKVRLFSGARPDWLGLQLLGRMLVRPDDGLLRAFAGALERRGIEIVASTLYMPEALAPSGVLTARGPTEDEGRDLRYGLEVARHIGVLDVGQTVVVREGAVVAIEAIEGTDACILRGGALCGRRGAVVVKAAKPAQDMRFDVPAVGPRTIEILVEAGATALGLEAGRTLILEVERTLRAADAHRICIVGLGGQDEDGP